MVWSAAVTHSTFDDPEWKATSVSVVTFERSIETIPISLRNKSELYVRA